MIHSLAHRNPESSRYSRKGKPDRLPTALGGKTLHQGAQDGEFILYGEAVLRVRRLDCGLAIAHLLDPRSQLAAAAAPRLAARR